jgi:hypothetical protein
VCASADSNIIRLDMHAYIQGIGSHHAEKDPDSAGVLLRMRSVQPITELQAHLHSFIYDLAVIKRVAGAGCVHPLI